MTRFHPVKLEIVRPGPPHNQLLSPLTSYMALSGDGAAVTFRINLEHHALLSRLERLRYLSAAGGGTAAVPDRVREAAAMEVGGEVAHVLAELRPLLAELARARGEAGGGGGAEPQELIHLRLSLGGSELSLLPFEMAISPQAFPGEGLELCLQLEMPVVLTRETRRSRPQPVTWNHEAAPRVLVVSASPAGLEVPLEAHLRALRAALEPWIEWPREEGAGREALERRRLPFVKERLRVLPGASIQDLYELSARESFSHVHILAHGARFERGGESRFGLVLSRREDPAAPEVVSGMQLSKALQAEGADGVRRSCPLLVTLMTCDSGDQGSVLVPGGSIAHDLHVEGIPWVIASQFPLTKGGSVRATEALYPRLLRGDDPRQALHEVRRLLYVGAERDHDWASLVAYASLAPDFDEQVMSYFERATRRAIDLSLKRADETASDEVRAGALERVQSLLAGWEARLPAGREMGDRERRAECYGKQGSTLKRIGLLHVDRGQPELATRAFLRALGRYQKAVDEWAMEADKHHWVATQALSLQAVLEKPRAPEAYRLTYLLARRGLGDADPEGKAWAHSTLAELELLAPYHLGDAAPPAAERERRIVEHCRAIVEGVGERSFQAYSTRRQFERYTAVWRSDGWEAAARAAVATLAPASGAPPWVRT